MEQPLWPIILAIIIPLIGFMLAFRPFIRDSAVRAAGEVVRDVQRDVAGVRQDVAELRGHLKGLEASLQAASWLQMHKLQELVKEQGPESKEKSGSLPLEKAARRDYLREQASAYGLTEEDATELRILLEEDARDDLARGLISLAAFVLILVGIGAIINGLSRR